MYQRILVPVDGSDTSKRGLEEAIKVSKALGSQLRSYISWMTRPWH